MQKKTELRVIEFYQNEMTWHEQSNYNMWILFIFLSNHYWIIYVLYLFKCMCIWFTSKVTLIIQMNEIDYVHKWNWLCVR